MTKIEYRVGCIITADYAKAQEWAERTKLPIERVYTPIYEKHEMDEQEKKIIAKRKATGKWQERFLKYGGTKGILRTKFLRTS